MDANSVAAIAIIAAMALPVVAISYAMTASNPRTRAIGFYSLALFAFLAAAAGFFVGITGGSNAGFLWMTGLAYATYWAWGKARAIGGA